MSDPWEAQESSTLPRFGLFKALFLSWGSPSFYRDVIHRWRGGGLLYLALLSFVVWLPLAAKTIYALVIAFGMASEIQEMPEFAIQNGELSIDAEQPLVFEENGKVQFVIDTTGTADQALIDRAEVYVNQHEIVQQRAFDTRVYPFKDVGDIVVDHPLMEKYYKGTLTALGILVYPLGVLSTFVWRAFWGVIYGAFLALAMGKPFLAGMRVAIVASTPMVMVGTLWSIVGWTPPGWFFLGWLMLLSWMAIAVGIARNTPAST